MPLSQIILGKQRWSRVQISPGPFISYFLIPIDLFFNRKYFLRHFLHFIAVIGFFTLHFKHILKNNSFFCANCFFFTSVIGISVFSQFFSLLNFVAYSTTIIVSVDITLGIFCIANIFVFNILIVEESIIIIKLYFS